VLQFSLFWACLAALVIGSPAGWLLFAFVLAARYIIARRIDTALKLAKAGDAWLFLIRDFCSVWVYMVSFLGDKVDWRGQMMRADAGKIAKI
jgi:hypothetical protein